MNVKKWLRIVKGMLAVAMVCVISTQVYASSLDDAQQDKKEAEDNKSNAEDILAGLEKDKNDLEVWITKLDGELSEIQDKIAGLNAEKEDLQGQISDKQAELEIAKANEEKQYANMCARIQFMYENDSVDYAEVLLSAASMSDVLNQSEYASAIADYDYRMLDELIQTREEIANAEQVLQMDLRSVETLTAQVEEEEATTTALIDEKSQKVEEYDDLIERQQKIIDECDAEIQAAAQKIAEIEAAAKANGEFVPYSGGALTWPCPSSTRITSYFGYRTPDGGYVNANHKGIDIGAPTGTPAVAAASGVVIISRYSNSAGNWVVISHGNGLYTMYMHGSKLCVTEGQYVNAGDTVLLVGSTGWSTGPHLHFGVGVGGYTSAYAVDPLTYFQ